MPAFKSIAFHAFEAYEKGRTRNLRYDINALADFEQLTGMGFGQLMSQKAMFATVRALLYAGLKHEDRTMTVDRVGDLIFDFINDENNPVPELDALMEKALEAAVAQGAMGVKAKKQYEEAEARKNAQAAPLALVPPAESTAPTSLPDLPGQVVG